MEKPMIDKIQSGEGNIEEVEEYIAEIKGEILLFSFNNMMLRSCISKLRGVCNIYNLDINNYIENDMIEGLLGNMTPGYVKNLDEQGYSLYSNYINDSTSLIKDIRNFKSHDIDYVIGKAYDARGHEMIGYTGVYTKRKISNRSMT